MNNKKEVRLLSLRLYNQELLNYTDIMGAEEMRRANSKQICECVDCIDEIIRIGKTEFKKKYNL